MSLRKSDLLSYLKSRNLLKQATSAKLPEKITIYCGFDATAKSLHIGHLIVLRILYICKNLGCKTIGLIGSGTTLLGDPTWKNETRPMLNSQDIQSYADSISSQIKSLAHPDDIVDNLQWFGTIRMLDFMRDIASYFSVNQLLSMETFSRRIEEQKHLSAMEFYYPLLQAYDFKHLNERYDCNVQLGGSDQWGNITQGISFVSRTNKKETFGLIADLLVNSNGQKMGKSISGAVYLDRDLCTPYDFWQFWRNVGDDDVERFLLQLTDLDEERIKSELSNITNAKKLLADCVTEWVHGSEDAIAARSKSEALFEGHSYDVLDEVETGEREVDKVLLAIGFASSLSEAKRIIQSGAIMIDDMKVLDRSTLLEEGKHVIKYGKKRYIKVAVL